MAGWLESLESFGTSVIDAGSEAVAGKIKSELAPDAPNDPGQRPETQYDVTIAEPLNGPESMPEQSPLMDTLKDTWATKKWWLVGALGLTGTLIYMRSR